MLDGRSDQQSDRQSDQPSDRQVDRRVEQEPDAAFADPRLARVHDALEGARPDLEAYAAIADELGARSVLDLGCGTGALALLLAGRGLEVTGVDPAAASLDVARGKRGSGGVRWIHGDAVCLPGDVTVDLALMTGNVAMAVLGEAWPATLAGLAAAVRPGGHLVFESRVPAARAWEGWTPERTRTTAAGVTAWCEVTMVRLPLVSFRWTYEFAGPPPGQVLTSESTLRFRDLAELVGDVTAAGFEVVDVRDAPDRPGLEHVVVARHAGGPVAGATDR